MGDTSYQHVERVLDSISGKDLNRPIADGISDSWQRCASTYGLDPSRRYAPRVEDATRIAELEDQYETLINLAQLEMDSLYEQISGSGYALLLTDPQGIILCEKVDPTLEKSFRAAGLVQGANWSEALEGTNGIGTCIARREAVTVHRDDHFRARHIDLSCTGAPIFDAEGDLTAVLDASCVNANYSRSSQMHTKAMVGMSARLIEKCLFLRRYRQNCVIRFHSRAEFVNLLHDAALAVDDRGNVVGVDNMAIHLLGGPSRESLVGRKINQILDIPSHIADPSLRQDQTTLLPVRDRDHGRRFYCTVQRPSGNERAPGKLRDAGSTRKSLKIMQCDPQLLSLQHLGDGDPVMQRNVRCARRLAASDVAILLQGPTGAGKDVFARAIHSESERGDKPFVAVNCAAIPETLIEAELFGYRSGAFTGARKEGARGRIMQADGGTLFLDEIGDMPLDLQTRLLRVLEERVVTPLGSEENIPVDIRLISASLRNLKQMVAEGRFREDLYYRLNGITLIIPPLSARRDIKAIIGQVLSAECGDGEPAAIAPEAMQHLLAYSWPGNIRELRNVIRTALAMREGSVITTDDLPAEILAAEHDTACATSVAPAPASGAMSGGILADAHAIDHQDSLSLSHPAARDGNPLERAERDAIIRTIEDQRYNMSRAAQALGVSRNTLYRKLRQHEIDPEQFRRSGSVAS